MKCNICDYEGKFNYWSPADDWHPAEVWDCPNCRSKNQHRLIWKICEEYKLFDIMEEGKILHCAPMQCLKDRFKKICKEYHSIDIISKATSSGIAKSDTAMDLRNLFFPRNSFDLIICSHVLDYIKEDRLALKEIYRVLKNSIDDNKFYALIILPIYEDLPYTEELEHQYKGRYRKCAIDYFNRYTEIGFEVDFIRYSYYPDWGKSVFDGEIMAMCYKK